MPLQLFLNELSAPHELTSRAISVSYLRQLVATVRKAREIDSQLILNSDVPLTNLPLGEGATIASIRNDGECVEESLYLKTVNNRAPLMLPAAEAGDRDPGLCEYRLRPDAPLRSGEVALGLGYAHLFDGLGLSLPSHDVWIERLIELDLAKLDPNGGIVNERVAARNADSPTAITDHAGALLATLAPTLISGEALWERRLELLPNLIFIPRTRAQICSLLAGDPLLEQTWLKLRGINQAIEAWRITQSPYPMFPFNVRPESRSRRALAEFEDAEGNRRIFSDHCDLAPTEARIHFIVESAPQRRALIGHVGRKLGIG
ncbi:hypothetical protein [Rhizobium halophilum]|uniref:hypothetical protein n=1 Tax=Rhizobium halophilum TaxID=2846852 RepID=UPI001EFE1368|nr:hypothetical protein [Rhizobium halophilum]MCF6368637.1 hypothetical protein [Rhizobium halophilum]